MVYSTTNLCPQWATYSATTTSEVTGPWTTGWINTITIPWGYRLTIPTTWTAVMGNTAIVTTAASILTQQWLVQPPPPPLNHRGRPRRLHNREQQFSDATPAELVALQLLRQMVTQETFRRYLRNGFLAVRGASGLTYQVFRQWAERVRVWDHGQHVASLCIHISKHGEIPPTDEVVAKLLKIEYEERRLWERSNVSWHIDQRERAALVQLGLDIKSGGFEIRPGQGTEYIQPDYLAVAA